MVLYLPYSKAIEYERLKGYQTQAESVANEKVSLEFGKVIRSDREEEHFAIQTAWLCFMMSLVGLAVLAQPRSITAPLPGEDRPLERVQRRP